MQGSANSSADRVSRLRDLARRLTADAKDLADPDLQQKMLKAAAELIDTAALLEGTANITPQSVD